VRGLTVGRDLHYVERGRHAVGEPLQLGPDEIFVLGDNSAESLDGREWGPTPLREVIGRPAAVVWPLGRLRGLSDRTWVREPAPGGD
jgi:type IV secretory pathway protease TraF